MGYEQEKINPYEKGVEKTQQVEQMFDNIAPTYDKPEPPTLVGH